MVAHYEMRIPAPGDEVSWLALQDLGLPTVSAERLVVLDGVAEPRRR
jgi:hypothetical protein